MKLPVVLNLRDKPVRIKKCHISKITNNDVLWHKEMLYTITTKDDKYVIITGKELKSIEDEDCVVCRTLSWARNLIKSK